MPLNPYLQSIINRMGAWDAQAQTDAVRVLSEIEAAFGKRQGALPLNPAERAAVQEALAQVDRRDFLEDAVAELYAKYNL